MTTASIILLLTGIVHWAMKDIDLEWDSRYYHWHIHFWSWPKVTPRKI